MGLFFKYRLLSNYNGLIATGAQAIMQSPELPGRLLNPAAVILLVEAKLNILQK
jgi:hypothetical protein